MRVAEEKLRRKWNWLLSCLTINGRCANEKNEPVAFIRHTCPTKTRNLQDLHIMLCYLSLGTKNRQKIVSLSTQSTSIVLTNTSERPDVYSEPKAVTLAEAGNSPERRVIHLVIFRQFFLRSDKNPKNSYSMQVTHLAINLQIRNKENGIFFTCVYWCVADRFSYSGIVFWWMCEECNIPQFR